jgi:hypothetical protein
MLQLGDEIWIEIGDESVELRPSLRNALLLERRTGSFPALAREVQAGSLSAAVEIVAQHHEHPFLENKIFDVLTEITPALLDYVAACAGIDQSKPPSGVERAQAGTQQTFRDYLTELYRIGTGWLGWTPDVTLASTPFEIVEAHQGKIAMLKAVYGSGETDAASKPDDRPLSQKFRTLFAGRAATKPEASA